MDTDRTTETAGGSMNQKDEIAAIYAELDEARQEQLAEEAARLLRQQQDES
jgi:hypothetical protein